jgi:flagellar hook-associated protein 1 FlgK
MADLLSTGISGVRTYQRALATVGNNIANVDTDGYSRQRLDIADKTSVNEGGLNIGNGVTAVRVQRSYDSFVAENLRSSQSQLSKHQTTLDYTTQLENLLADQQLSLSSSVDGFFAAVQEVSVSPSSGSARQNMLNLAQTTASQFNTVGAQLARIEQTSYNDIQAKVSQLNQFASQLANINSSLNKASNINKQPNQLLDLRDTLIQDMSKLMQVVAVERANGSVDVHMGDVPSGQYLVQGNKSNRVTIARSATNPEEAVLMATVGNSSQALNQPVGGSIAGIAEFRGHALTSLRNELDALVQVFVGEVNAAHTLGIDAQGQFGGDLFSLANIYAVTPGTNTGTAAVTLSAVPNATIDKLAMNLSYSSSTGLYTLADAADAAQFVTGTSELTLAGVKVTLSGVPQDGDSFSLTSNKRPIDALQALVTNHTHIASGAPVSVSRTSVNTSATRMVLEGYSKPVATAANTAIGAPDRREALRQNIDIEFAADATAYILKDVATSSTIASGTYTPGSTIEHNGWKVSFNGTIEANDSFTVRGNNTYQAGDNRNLLSLISLQGNKDIFNGGGDFTQVYTDTISHLGSSLVQSAVGRDAQQIIVDQAQAKRDETSAVSLDEEAANLLRFQQAYQASAQIISTANKLFDTILDIR